MNWRCPLTAIGALVAAGLVGLSIMPLVARAESLMYKGRHVA